MIKSVSKKNPENHEQPALSHDALFAKSRLYAERALQAKKENQEDVYQLWAALALELLGKTSLAKIHPSLIVEASNANSLLEANRISTGTVIRTIDSNILFARLKHTVHRFGTSIFEACKKLAERRNAELHSGHAAFAAMPLESWEGDFWHAAQLILASMNLNLEDWLEAKATIPKELLENLRHIKREAAKQSVEHAKAMFDKNPNNDKDRTKKEKDNLRSASRNFKGCDYSHKFRYIPDKTWAYRCPACECIGFLGGNMISEDRADDQESAEPGFEIVEREYLPGEFFCPTCELHLIDDEALDEVGLNDIHIENSEREFEYEDDDYGND